MHLPLPICAVILCFGAVGCASYPLGLSKEQWTALPPDEQARLVAKQAEIDAEDRKRAAELREARDRMAAEVAAREAEQAGLIHATEPEKVVTVQVRSGMVAFNGKRFPYEPVAFDIVPGETKRVKIARQGNAHITTEVVMKLSADGNSFYFDEPATKRFVALRDARWEQGGRQYAIHEIGSGDGRSEAIGVELFIRLKNPPRRRG